MKKSLHRSCPHRFIVACILLGLALLAPAGHPRHGLATLQLAAGEAFAAVAVHAGPSEKDKCPVCGMFVSKYPDFTASVTYRDGAVFYFDGAKDLFKYYSNVAKYHPSRKQKDIVSVSVTDYYSLAFVDGFKAYYVGGGNIYGPMGKELIPFGSETDAKTFMVDHIGKALYRFSDVNDAVLKTLE